MRPVLILAAVELEARALARELELPPVGGAGFALFGRSDVRLACVGLRAALLGPRWRSALGGLTAPLVISAGLCGGLDPRLRPGDLVVPAAVGAPGGERIPVSAPHHAAAAALAPMAATGLLVTTRDVAATASDKSMLFDRTGAVACDMESSIVVVAAGRADLPAIVARAVSDGARQALPPALTRLVAADGTLKLGRAVALIATRPDVLPRAVGLHRATRSALRALSSFLARVVG